ncbi:MAG: GDP-mannose 4,6-dehydratase [Pyrinomonadaceae bacterium]
MKAIIFGASGQDGFYLKQLLGRENVEAVCVSRSGDDVTGDVADWDFVEQLIKTHAPDFVFHLAADSTTSHEALFDNHAAISTGTINILEAVYRHSRDSKVFLSASAMQFENNGTPIDENTPFAPLSPYAVSRIQSVYAGRYFRSLGLKSYVGYFFNHDSPRRAPNHINQRIAAAAKNISKGSVEHIEIGDITVKKEFNYAGDIVESVWLLVNQDDIFEAVIGSGAPHTIEEWLELCFASVNKNWRDHVVVRKDFTPEYKSLVSNPALIKSLGWLPKVDITTLARIMMEDQ